MNMYKFYLIHWLIKEPERFHDQFEEHLKVWAYKQCNINVKISELDLNSNIQQIWTLYVYYSGQKLIAISTFQKPTNFQVTPLVLYFYSALSKIVIYSMEVRSGLHPILNKALFETQLCLLFTYFL